jgi:hypothetical protein
VVIGNSVTSIGERAFYDCKSLTSVVFKNPIPITYNSSLPWFTDCVLLTRIYVPYGCKQAYIDKWAADGATQDILDLIVESDKNREAMMSDVNILREVIPTNIENGEGVGSLEQKNGKAYATGEGAVALNGGYKVQDDGTITEGVRAFGKWSIAGGKDTEAYQRCAVAIGGGNKAGLTLEEFNAKYPSGKDEHGKTYEESYSFATAEGVTTIATGYAAHAENESTEATGHRSHASGQETHATGNRSFATGYKTNATNLNSFTMGEEANATGINSLAGGFKSTSSNYCSLAFGENCTASNIDAVATGYYTEASGKYSFAAGRACLAGGEATVAVGRSNKTTIDYQFVCGTYCKENTADALLVVGNGDGTNDRSNAFEVLQDGRAKVYTAPKEDSDVVRKVELDKKAAISDINQEFFNSLYK